jgi:hypothetical protein
MIMVLELNDACTLGLVIFSYVEARWQQGQIHKELSFQRLQGIFVHIDLVLLLFETQVFGDYCLDLSEGMAVCQNILGLLEFIFRDINQQVE